MRYSDYSDEEKVTLKLRRYDELVSAHQMFEDKFQKNLLAHEAMIKYLAEKGLAVYADSVHGIQILTEDEAKGKGYFVYTPEAYYGEVWQRPEKENK